MKIEQRNDNLTKEQELELGRKIQLMRVYKQDENFDYAKLTDDEKKLVSDGDYALEVLVGNHINLARDIVHKNHKKSGTRYELEDLLQDAISALVEAACSYDPNKNCRLSTHAYYGISKRVSSTINYQRIVRLPENKMGEYIKITKAQKEYQLLEASEKKKYKSELDYVYKHSEVKKEEVDIVLNNMQPQISLNSAIFESKGELLDTLKDESGENEIRKVEKLDPKLEKILSYLTAYQRDLIAFEFEAFEPTMDYKVFLDKYNLTERDFAREIRKVITVLKSVSKKRNIKVSF